MDYTLPYVLKVMTKEVGEYWKGIQIPGLIPRRRVFSPSNQVFSCRNQVSVLGYRFSVTGIRF